MGEEMLLVCWYRFHVEKLVLWTIMLTKLLNIKIQIGVDAFEINPLSFSKNLVNVYTSLPM